MDEIAAEEMINKNLIKMDLKGITKEDAISELANLLYNNGNLKSIEEFLDEVKRRESLGTTGIGMGIAIPHGKCRAVTKPAVAFGKSSKGILWDSMDGNPVNLVFLLAVPDAGASNQHLQILAMLSRKLIHDEFREGLMKAKDEKELLEMLQSVFKEA
jgi:fructose-specific phosphotransferase system IIA component